MAHPRGVLLEEEAGWRLLTSQGGEFCSYTMRDTDESESANAIVEQLNEISATRWQLIVAPSAGSILPARLNESEIGGPRVPTGQMLAYVAEEHLPWTAEDLTVQAAAPALALAALTNRWEGFFTELRRAGHTLCACVPAALLRLQAIRNACRFPPDAIVLFQDGEGIQFINQRKGLVVDWRFWPVQAGEADDRPDLIAAELAAEVVPLQIHTVRIEPALESALDRFGFDIVDADDALANDDELVWQGAQRFWKPRSAALNLAVGRLAGTTHADALVSAARCVLTALLLCCCATAGVLWWKSEQFRLAAGQWRAEQVALFQETFPDIPVPQALSARFDSEHRRIVGQRGGSGEISLPGSALAGLRAVLAAHESPLRCRFEEVNVTDELVEIEAQFRNHEDAARMVARLQQHGIRVDPPQLQKLDDKRFGTRLRGRLAAATGGDR